MQRTFIYTQTFEKAWRSLGLNDEDLVLLESELLKYPQAGVVVPGTKGLRKLRVPANGHGKRSGARVIYVDFYIEEQIYLIAAYGKNEQQDLTVDQKKQINKLIETLEGQAKKRRS